MTVAADAVAARAVLAKSEAKDPRVVKVRARNGRPEVAVRSGVVERSPVAVACDWKKDTS